MAQISVVQKSQLEGAMRLDAEYYQPKYLQAYDLVKNYRPLREYQKKILHPKEIKRIYADDDSRIIFLLAQNIKRGYLDFSTIAYISPETAAEIPQNRLEHGDVVLTRTGANYGDTACYLGVPSPVYASAHCLVIRPKEVSGLLLSVYLNTQIGQMLIKRGVYGSSQPEIAPDYLKTIPIPRFGSEQERSIEELVRSRLVLDQKSDSLYLQAEQLLLDELGFKDLDLSHQLYWTVPFKKTKEADRLDAEHFQPKYERLIQHLVKTGRHKKLQGILKEPVQKGITPQYDSDGDIIVVNSQHLGRYCLNIEATDRTTQAFWQQNKRAQIKPKDVMVYATGAYIGRTNIWPVDYKAMAGVDVLLIRPSEACNPYYLSVYLNSPLGVLQAEKFASGSGQQHIYPDDISRFMVYLPSKEFQQRIADLVIQSWEARQKARQLLEEAKKKVENLIEGKA
jgi:type I restriction enzyme S subunit